MAGARHVNPTPTPTPNPNPDLNPKPNQVHDMLCGTFDFYAALSDRDSFAISQKSWSLFVNDFDLADAGSKLCTKSHLDQLFVASDANAEEKIAPLAKGAVKQAGNQTLNRQEFLQLIVRVAVTKHVLTTKATDDVSDAVGMLARQDLAPSLSRECGQDSNAFRRRQCYTEAVDGALRAHESSLRVLFQQYATGEGLIRNEADRQASSGYPDPNPDPNPNSNPNPNQECLRDRGEVERHDEERHVGVPADAG